MHVDFEISGRRRDGNDGILRRRIISEPENRRSEEETGILRRRSIAGPDLGVDGTSNHSGQGFDGAYDSDATLRTDAINDRSSYTDNTLGGFHDPSNSVEFI